MTNRENFFAAMAGQPYERVLLDMNLCDQLREKLRVERGVDNFRAYYQIPFRRVPPLPSRNPVDYTPYFAGKDIDYIGEWGDGHKYGGTEHFTYFVPCMEEFETPGQVWNFPLPDLDAEYRWADYAERVRACKEQDLIAIGGVQLDIFEPAWYLRGLEQMLTDFYTEEEMAEACLERITQIKERIARIQAAAGVDVIIYGDDVGTQIGMMMSPDIWRKFLKPRLARVIKAAKEVNPNVLCYYHSDGDIRKIIPELIEVGVEILNPIQPECMDPREIYQTYVDRLRFWGAVGTQSTMPFGTPAEVRQKTLELLEMSSQKGRLVLAPTHLLEPEVPLENIDMLVKTVQEYRNKR